MSNLIWFPMILFMIIGCAAGVNSTDEDITLLGKMGMTLFGLLFGAAVLYSCFVETCKFGICETQLDALRSSWWDLGLWLFHISPESSGNWWIIIFWAIYGIIIFISIQHYINVTLM